jgi:large subunit ribosomal protein L18e
VIVRVGETTTFIKVSIKKCSEKSLSEQKCAEFEGDDMKKLKKTNPRLVKLVEDLREKGYTDNVNLWKEISRRLCRPTRRMAELNLWKLEKYTAEGDTVIVPGKVLGSGRLDHKLTVAALKFSEKAYSQITKAGGNAITIETLMEKNPQGTNVIIME